MKIPANPLDREGFYSDLIGKCLLSRSDRRSEYDVLRSYFTRGAAPGAGSSAYNKIYPHIDQLTSFLFASDTTRFSVELGASVPENSEDFAKVPPLVQRLNDKWHDAGCDIAVYNAIRWALCYNSTFIKLIQRGRQTLPFTVEPHDFGVLREDVTRLDDQEAFVHVFRTTRSELARDLLRHPNGKSISERVSANAETEAPSGADRIIVSNLTPIKPGVNVTGNVDNPLGAYGAIDRPRVAEDMIEGHELWVWNDDANDYQIATLMAGGVCVYDRPNFFYPGESPFIHLCPNPSPDYFWGASEVERLIGLQDMRTHRMAMLNELLDIQVKPPTAMTGWNGMIDEKAFAAFAKGGVLSNDTPGAKVERFAPTVPADTFAEIREIDAMFAEMSAMSNVLSGRGESGVRSKGHAAELARLGSSRPKQRALIVEDALEKIATLYLKLDRQHDDAKLTDTKGRPFLSAMLSEDFTVKVDAHSSSPVFMEDLKATALQLYDRKAIDRRALLQLMHPPMLRELLVTLSSIEAAEARAAAEKAKLEQEKISAKGLAVVK